MLFGFCPGKATWYHHAVALYRMLTACVVYKSLPYKGALTDQPDWIVSLLAEFGPRYEAIQWSSRMRELLGDGKGDDTNKTGVKNQHGNHNRRIAGKSSR